MADLTIRDWMVIIGALLILAVLLDAWRRIRQERRAPVRMKLVEGEHDDEADEVRSRDIDIAWLRELPNGGARVVERDHLDADEFEQDLEPVPERPSPVLRRPVEDWSARRSAEQAAAAAAEAEAQLREAEKAALAAVEEASGQQDDDATAAHAARQSTPDTATVENDGDYDGDHDGDEVLAGMNSLDEPENLDWLDALDSDQKRGEPEPAAAVQLPPDIDPEVFMLNVLARNPEGFRGEDILHILLACDLRFGEMGFFHRHEQEAGRGPIQFSVANMMKPGVFDIDNMADFTTTGLVFFVTLPGPEDMMTAFDYMLETAQAVARNLQGDVLDETRSVLTRQTLEHTRQKIRDLERRLLAATR